MYYGQLENREYMGVQGTLGYQGIHGYTWVYRVYMGMGIQDIQGTLGYTVA